MSTALSAEDAAVTINKSVVLPRNRSTPLDIWFKSELADLNDNNNYFGFKNERVDELIDLYDSEFDLEKRIEIGKEVDKIVAEIHPVSYGIKRLYRRFLFWDDFGYPEYMVDRFVGNYQSIHKLWWFEPEKIKSLEEAMENNEQLPVNEVDIRYWPNWNKSKK